MQLLIFVRLQTKGLKQCIPKSREDHYWGPVIVHCIEVQAVGTK